MKNIKQQLAELKNDVPETARFLFLRERLMDKIAFRQFNESKTHQYTIFSIFFANLFTPQSVAYAVVGVFCLLVIATSAHIIPSLYGANPGEPLYNARVAIERMPLIVMSDQNKVVKEASLAKKRQNEVDTILASSAGAEDKSKKVESVVKHLSRNISETSKQINELGKNKNETQKVRDAVSAVKVSVADIKKSIKELNTAVAEGELSEETSEVTQKVSLQITDAEFTTLGILIEAEDQENPQESTSPKQPTKPESADEEVRMDLESAMSDLEKAVQELKAESKSEPAPVPSEEEVKTEEVILDVTAIIDQESSEREQKERIQTIDNLIAQAKEFVLQSEFKSAWSAIKEAQKLVQSDNN
ncbi:MAG TPA: hypothetical protein DEP11_02270 [Candidatus Jacksonbacteria bacterium]|nr:hypothetical protein [Candidatus Jacksonbacteria bacterium]